MLLPNFRTVEGFRLFLWKRFISRTEVRISPNTPSFRVIITAYGAGPYHTRHPDIDGNCYIRVDFASMGPYDDFSLPNPSYNIITSADDGRKLMDECIKEELSQWKRNWYDSDEDNAAIALVGTELVPISVFDPKLWDYYHRLHQELKHNTRSAITPAVESMFRKLGGFLRKKGRVPKGCATIQRLLTN